jgi:protein involved in polysaccharide export with SLBB domain
MKADLLALLVVVFGATAAAASSSQAVGGQVAETASLSVLVTGEVRYPGRAMLTASTMTVPDALAAVGSPTNGAGDDVVVIRASKSGGVPERHTITIADIEQGTAGVDVALQDGDIVNVPIAKRFYISGFVVRPGAYKILTGMTVGQAIVLVGGLAAGGTDRRVRIVRVVNGKTIEITAQLNDPILANDQIKVQRKMF